MVDFIVELAKPAERKVTPQELLALPEPDDDEAADGGSKAGRQANQPSRPANPCAAVGGAVEESAEWPITSNTT